MSTQPWPSPFVGAHLLLNEPGKIDSSWDTWPSEWDVVRFDAIDVLFISPFRVMDSDYSFNLMQQIDGGLLTRFETVIRAARTKNPNIKIIVEQFYINKDESRNDFNLLTGDAIQTYATSVSSFIESYFHKTLPSFPPGSSSTQVSARINGWDADIEGSTNVHHLTSILLSLRASLDNLSTKLGCDKFSTSITPAWTDGLNSETHTAVDYINMQNYSGGDSTYPQDYKDAAPGLEDSQLVWGLCVEEPWRNTRACKSFGGVQTKLESIIGNRGGVYSWRVNSDNRAYENMFQVWLYNQVHGTELPDSAPEEVVGKYWAKGGRKHVGGPMEDLT